MKRLEPLAQTSGVRLHFSSQGHIPEIYVDEVQMGTALSNLLKNAIQASEYNQKVEINVLRASQSIVLIRVLDQGLKLEADEAERLFRPFVSGKRDGLGLGLSISRSLIENNGGTLDYESTPEKCFVIKFYLEDHRRDEHIGSTRAAGLRR
ncbi:MAG: ATP-binding protein [Betaproteobacteria bacterium]|nr:ATP-binding protein [Betaproteobacteria bacterium]